MRRILLTLALAAAVPLLPPAVAQQANPSGRDAQSSRPVAPNPAEFDKQMAQWQDYMQQMQAQMDKIRATQDPQERQKLLQEHWTSMQAAMATMHGMWGPGGGMGCCAGGSSMGPGMMGPMMGWGHMRGYYSQLTPEQIRQRQYMMDRYLPMQQMMMNHMMWHQQWMNPGPAPAK